MAIVHFNGQEARLAAGATLFQAADAVPHARREVASSCPRAGTCRECIVRIRSGHEHLTAPTPQEAFLVARSDGDGVYRLACQARITHPEATVEVETFHRRLAIATTGKAVETRPEPWFCRQGDEVLLNGRSVGRHSGPLYGLAIDVGTTTVVLHLVELETGDTAAIRAFENPQRYGGSNIIHRICYDRDRPGQLRETLIAHLNDVLREIPIAADSIIAAAIAGNSTMRDLLFGLNVQTIGSNPFMSATQLDVNAGRRATTAVWAEVAELGLRINPGAAVYGLPLISHHVGADMAAVLATIPIERHDRPFLVIDIGTNTEVVIGAGGRLLCASCPAGPAFEGGHLGCGMAAADGAIAHLRRSDGTWDLSVIGDVRPRGVCGSGLVDVLSELRRSGEMDELGRLSDGDDGVTLSREPLLRFTRRDAAELAQAKSANALGQAVLLRKLGINASDIGTYYLAGAFATHMDIAAAQRIGLLLPVPAERIVTVGNASVEGAKAALVSRSVREHIEALVRGIEHVELENEPDFFHLYADMVYFEPIGTR